MRQPRRRPKPDRRGALRPQLFSADGLLSPPQGTAEGCEEGLVLIEAHVIALEEAKTEKEAHGEFESGILRIKRCEWLIISSTGRSKIRARASATLWRMPPDSCPGAS
jgi:hypothetical protein